MTALASRLLSVVAARVGAGAAEWLSGAARRRDGGLAVPFAAASRRLGRRALDLSEAETAVLGELGLDWPLARWSVADAGRAALLLSAAGHLPAARLEALVADLYRHGDAGEQASLMRSLELLPCPAVWLGLARQAARGGIPVVLEALARHNPYPVRHFPDEALERLVAEAAALGIGPDEIWALERRREARGRPVLEAS